MYDKLTLWLPTLDANNAGTLLTGAKEQVDRTTGEVNVFGSYQGLKLSIYPSGIYVRGSLSKYLYPNNIYPLDRRTTQEAVTRLSDELHLNMMDAKVNGLEYGQTFVMKCKPSRYLPLLGGVTNFIRCQCESNTLYYQTRGQSHNRSLVFYDKKSEAKTKGMDLPAGFDKLNLLKYELRLHKRLPMQLREKEVKASTLYDESFYRKIMGMYQARYFSISKLNEFKSNYMDSINKVSDAYDVLVSLALNNLPPDAIDRYIQELKDEDVFSNRGYYTRLKAKIRDVQCKSTIMTNAELIKELDEEIKNVGAYL